MAHLFKDCIFLVLYVCITFHYIEICTANVGNNAFMKASLLSEIGEYLEVDNLSEVHGMVTSLLDNCTLTPSFAVRGLGGCLGWCMLNTECMAVAYTRNVGCMHCLPIEADGTGNGGSEGLSQTYISMFQLNSTFEAYNSSSSLTSTEGLFISYLQCL